MATPRLLRASWMSIHSISSSLAYLPVATGGIALASTRQAHSIHPLSSQQKELVPETTRASPRPVQKRDRGGYNALKREKRAASLGWTLKTGQTGLLETLERRSAASFGG